MIKSSVYECITTTLASTSLSYYDEESDDHAAKGVSKTTEDKTPMSKMTIITLLATFFLAMASFGDAQQPTKIPRVGFLRGSGPDESDVQVFLQGLKELGWVEGKNLTVEHRWGKSEQYSTLVTELVDLKVDVIVVDGTGPALATKK